MSMPVSPARPSVLVVEDDTTSRTLMCGMISRRFPELQVHSALNGKNGLELYKQYTPKVVVTNLHMPEMNGISMIEEITSTAPDTKFIVVTGFSHKINLLEDLDVDYLLKPINFEDVMWSIEECLVSAPRSVGAAI